MLLSLTEEQKTAIGLRIEELLQNEMRYIANFYISRYRAATAASLGWSKEDLTQSVKIALWKGLATFDSSKNFKVETYLSSILRKYFASLAKRCRSAKKNRVLHIEDCVRGELDDSASAQDHLMANHPKSEENRPDDLAHKQTSIERFTSKLSDLELKVLEAHVVKGRSIPVVAKDLNLPRNQITKTVKALRIELKHHLRRDEDDGDNL